VGFHRGVKRSVSRLLLLPERISPKTRKYTKRSDTRDRSDRVNVLRIRFVAWRGEHIRRRLPANVNQEIAVSARARARVTFPRRIPLV